MEAEIQWEEQVKQNTHTVIWSDERQHDNIMIELRQAANLSDTHRFLFNHLITFCVKSHKVYD